MKKKEYAAPGIDANAFAQFENVYTACDKNPSRNTCVWDPDSKENSGPPTTCHHQNTSGPAS